RIVADVFRGAQYRPAHLRLRISGKLVSIRAAALRDRSGSRVRVAVAEHAQPGTFEPGEVHLGPPVRRAGIRSDGAGRIAYSERRTRRTVVARRLLFSSDPRRDSSEPGGTQRDDQTRA